MKFDRRRFLTWLGGTPLLGAAGAAFAVRAEAEAHPQLVDGSWDMSWADRVASRKFRAVFDSPELDDGDALFRAITWCDQYGEVYGTPRQDMAPVLVLRHRAIPLIMGDEYWRRFKIGKEKKVLTPEGKKWAEANPIGSPSADSASTFGKYTLQKFMADGGTVLACNFAFAMVVGRFEQEEKLDSAAARRTALAGVVPGIILQPSGIFAVLRAQEAGCRYVLAS